MAVLGTGRNNVVRRTLRTFGYAANEQDVELSTGGNHHELRGRLTGTLTISGGTTSGTPRQNAIVMLISAFRVLFGTADVLPTVDGRDLLDITRRSKARISEPTALASGAAQVLNFAFNFVIPWSWLYYANPYDVFLPVRGGTDARVFFSMPANDSAALRAALYVSGAVGDRDHALSNISLELFEKYTVGNAMPAFIPVWTIQQSEVFAAANAQLEMRQRMQRRLAAQLFTFRQGASGERQDGINTVTVAAGNSFSVERVSYPILKEEELATFPAVPTTELGALMLTYADNGKLGTAYFPARDASDPRVVFDVDAPTGAPGVIRALNYELHTQAGVTSVTD